MRNRLPLLAAIFCAAPLLVPDGWAMPDCRPAGPIGAGLRKLIGEFAAVAPGRPNQAPVHDFLVGVSNIPLASQRALLGRGPVRILPSGNAAGDLVSDGAQSLQFEGVFARKRTFFKVPKRIRARYTVAKGSLTLAYEEGAAIELGEAVPLVDIPVYRRINHVVVTPDRLLFFWGSNSDGEPDRCYVPSAG